MSEFTFSILVVDDDPETRDVLRRFLQDPRFNVEEADSARTALDLLLKKKPDCVLLDYRLPDMDGLSLIEEWERTGATPPLPVVMVTGQGDETVAVEAMRRGVQDYLVKDRVTKADLLRAVENTMEKVRLNRTIDGMKRDHAEQIERLKQEIRSLATLRVGWNRPFRRPAVAASVGRRRDGVVAKHGAGGVRRLRGGVRPAA
ncbi:MAG: response regulator [Planctomycetia bacterium]